jgi:hypothetical protein
VVNDRARRTPTSQGPCPALRAQIGWFGWASATGSILWLLGGTDGSLLGAGDLSSIRVRRCAPEVGPLDEGRNSDGAVD